MERKQQEAETRMGGIPLGSSGYSEFTEVQECES